MLRRLKSGQIYVDNLTGRIGILRRSNGLFRLKRQWQIDFGHSVMPAELNPRFVALIRNHFSYIGEL